MNISVENDGTVFVAGVDGVSVKAALSAINGMTKDVESGDIYTGKVVKTTNFAFVELMPGRDGLIHISASRRASSASSASRTS